MLLTIASACGALLVFVVVRDALAQHSTFRHPTAIALLVSILAFAGMQGLAADIIRLLLPAMALAVVVVFTMFMMWALGKRQANQHQSANGAGASLNGRSDFEAALKSGAQVLGRIGSGLANAICDLWNRPGEDGKGLAVILAAVALGVAIVAVLLLVQLLPIALMVLLGVALYRAIRHNWGIR